jgi:hypothetical protein
VKSEERDRRYGNGNGRVLQYVCIISGKMYFFQRFYLPNWLYLWYMYLSVRDCVHIYTVS